MKKKSKRYKNLLKMSVKDKKLDAKEILDLVKKNSSVKFDESVDVSLKMNINLMALKHRSHYKDYLLHKQMHYSSIVTFLY